MTTSLCADDVTSLHVYIVLYTVGSNREGCKLYLYQKIYVLMNTTSVFSQ